jgi:tetratricopeptide (TPR) repeat protein
MLAMHRLLLVATLPALAIALTGAGPLVDAAGGGSRLVIMGNSQARQCSEHAFLVADGKMSPSTAVATCTEALTVEQLSPADVAATYNNRGVVRLGMLDEAPYAIDDFNAALKADPEMAESYVNRGAYLLREQRYGDALAELNRGIELGPTQPWRAYYNRAVAREHLNDVRGAYEDYNKAIELKPDWEAPKQELARFQVRTVARP